MERRVKKTTEFLHTLFSADVLREAYQTFLHTFRQEEKDIYQSLEVQIERVTWGHDSVEEFLADYRNLTGIAKFSVSASGTDGRLWVRVDRGSDTCVVVEGPDRQTIETLYEVFEKHAEASMLPQPPKPPPPRPKIFRGHGHSPLWRDLKDHLHEQHGYEVDAYEVGARAGHTIRDILESMLGKGTLAILVMSGEDATRDERLMPRLNVVHELGLFQGRLGFSKAIVLLEEGTQEFSNIHGTHQIRFTKGNIKETFGDVLATLGREFPGGGK